MRIRLIALLVVMSLGLGSCSLLALSTIKARTTSDLSAVDLDQDLRPAPESDTAELVERVLPAVVNVKATLPGGQGEGSGVMIDPNGVILTNNHVVQNAVSIEVLFNDGTDAVEGRVIGGIPESDLAVIQIPGSGYDAIRLGSSDRLRLGDDVIAIGYPLGLGGPTVTRGIISGQARTIETNVEVGSREVPVKLEGLLQTDAAINPGNSGGALVDAAGRLVGINTAVAGLAENIGFAIAIDDALPTVEEILEDPEEEHAWLGVSTSPIDPASATELGLDPDAQGVFVVEVFEGTPAARAGIVEGVVMSAIDGEAIRSPSDLTRLITEHDPGDEVDIVLITPQGEDTVTVELAVRPVTLEIER
jgi:S1-C subfamily serine protease